MNWMKYRRLYFVISAIFIIAGIFAYFRWGLKLGVDFTGGSVLDFRFSKKISTEDLTGKLSDEGYQPTSIQNVEGNEYLIKFPPLNLEDKNNIVDKLNGNENYKGEELSYESVGPSIGPELVKKTFYAILISAGTILLWVAYQFKSLKFGVSAILAMLHDSAILIGFFAILGHFFGAEADFLFFTALLTILSFSVHDTIVVYDRIREIHRKEGGELKDVANTALTETMVRSLNNSFTILFMLLALMLMGGSTTKWFSVALLIGTISGTYSSPFVAVPILVTWDEIEKQLKNKK